MVRCSSLLLLLQCLWPQFCRQRHWVMQSPKKNSICNILVFYLEYVFFHLEYVFSSSWIYVFPPFLIVSQANWKEEALKRESASRFSLTSKTESSGLCIQRDYKDSVEKRENSILCTTTQICKSLQIKVVHLSTNPEI